MNKGIKYTLITAACIMVIIILKSIFFDEEKVQNVGTSGPVGIPIQNIAKKYNATIQTGDAETLRKKTDVLEYYLQGEPTESQATLIYKFDGEHGEWRGTIVFNPSTLKGSFREEYPGKTPRFGTVDVKPHYTGGFKLTFTYDKEVVSYQALFLPVWW